LLVTRQIGIQTKYMQLECHVYAPTRNKVDLQAR
jgi:hypothetical protein